ncbi:MAG: chemotaxis protein CheW [Thermoflexales bacterium]|nr:chemotaxis protein CheW [Thermoflexales bacterium]
MQTQKIQLVIFSLDQLEFGVPVEQVWRVESMAEQTVTRVPRAPAFLEGVVNVRGQIIPALDLKKRFELGASQHRPRARLLIVHMQDQRVGLIVDTVSDIALIPSAQVEPPPPMVAQISGVFVQGVARQDQRLLIILNLNETLDPRERQALKELGQSSSTAQGTSHHASPAG